MGYEALPNHSLFWYKRGDKSPCAKAVGLAHGHRLMVEPYVALVCVFVVLPRLAPLYGILFPLTLPQLS